MDFPNVEQETENRYARLWPLVSQNEELKAAAAVAPEMLKFSREGGQAHYKLYENRIPPSFNADAAFGAYATEDARAASAAEGEAKRNAKVGIERAQRASADKAYPEEVRYYPAIAEGNRERFHEAVKAAGLTSKAVKNADDSVTPADVAYMPSIKAFVSKVGPVPGLAEWQSPEAKAMWEAEGERLAAKQREPLSRGAEATEIVKLRGEGKHFLADNLKGLLMPPSRNVAERDAVKESIGQASIEDLKTVQQTTQAEHKALVSKQFAIQIKAAQAKDPSLTVDAFKAMPDAKRRDAAGYNELTNEDFTRKIGLQYGLKAINDELKARGEHMSVEEAREKKGRNAPEAEKKSVDEKDKGMKAKPAPEQAAGKPSNARAGNKGAAHATALAATLSNRGR